MRTSLFIFFMVIFIGCSENDIDIVDEEKATKDLQSEIEVYYEQGSTSSRKPEVGVKVYLYYDITLVSTKIH